MGLSFIVFDAPNFYGFVLSWTFSCSFLQIAFAKWLAGKWRYPCCPRCGGKRSRRNLNSGFWYSTMEYYGFRCTLARWRSFFRYRIFSSDSGACHIFLQAFTACRLFVLTSKVPSKVSFHFQFDLPLFELRIARRKPLHSRIFMEKIQCSEVFFLTNPLIFKTKNCVPPRAHFHV